MRLQIIALSCLLVLSPLYGKHKMIYGTDDRQEAENYPIAIFRQLAESTAAAISTQSLRRVGFAHYLIEGRSLQEELNLCPGTPYGDQLYAAKCSGVLIAPDKILTAGHCVQDFQACQELKWVFGFKHKSNLVGLNQVYSCQKILAFEASEMDGLDYAIVKLDRKVTGRAPVFAARDVDVQPGDEMVVIGHPSGLPLKIADNGFVREDAFGDLFFRTNLDTFIFNSGSPVYDKITAHLQGILVRGDIDYVYDFSNDCTTIYQTSANEGRGEDVIRIDAIPNLGRYLD